MASPPGYWEDPEFLETGSLVVWIIARIGCRSQTTIASLACTRLRHLISSQQLAVKRTCKSQKVAESIGRASLL